MRKTSVIILFLILLTTCYYPRDKAASATILTSMSRTHVKKAFKKLWRKAQGTT
jgi:hypothetical protein